jgi:hypothetical protein
MATAYKEMAGAGEEPAYSRFADISAFFAKFASEASH